MPVAAYGGNDWVTQRFKFVSRGLRGWNGFTRIFFGSRVVAPCFTFRLPLGRLEQSLFPANPPCTPVPRNTLRKISSTGRFSAEIMWSIRMLTGCGSPDIAMFVVAAIETVLGQYGFT